VIEQFQISVVDLNGKGVMVLACHALQAINSLLFRDQPNSGGAKHAQRL
jgi:hypothetical protein